MVFSKLQSRYVVPELMDAPGLDPVAHMEALHGLGRINRVSKAAALMAGPISEMARRRGLNQLTMLDVACGGGDVPVSVARILRDWDIAIELTMTDRNETALGQAQDAAERERFSVLAVPGEAPSGLPAGVFDVVTCSLFLHHLNRSDVVATLVEMRKRARRMVMVSDLRRSIMGWAIAWSACRMLSRSVMVHHDGPASVRAAWTIQEMCDMAAEAGMDGAVVKGCWPWRMLLVWEARG